MTIIRLISVPGASLARGKRSHLWKETAEFNQTTNVKTLILLDCLFGSFIFSDEIGTLNEQVSKEYGGTKYRYHHIEKHSPDIKESINLTGKEEPNRRSDKPCEEDKGKTNGSMEKKCPFTHHHLRDIYITDKCRGNNGQ